RDDTIAQLEVLRDVVYPTALERLRGQRAALYAYGRESSEAKREAREPIFGIENGLKAFEGYLRGLRDKDFMATKAASEKALLAAIQADPKLKDKYGNVFDTIAKVQQVERAIYPRYSVLERNLGGDLLWTARQLVRLPAEKQLPDDQRLREYRESGL